MVTKKVWLGVGGQPSVNVGGRLGGVKLFRGEALSTCVGAGGAVGELLSNVGGPPGAVVTQGLVVRGTT